MLSSLEMDTATRVQILDKSVCISQSAIILGKSMNRIILFPFMNKQMGRLRSLTLICQPVLKENSEFKPVKLHLKLTFLYRGDRLVNIHIYLNLENCTYTLYQNFVIRNSYF